MAAAGTLSRPSSAQGTYSMNAFQTYYTPPSPTVTHSTYARPSSAGANYTSESYSTYRKPGSSRPTPFRAVSSTQYITPSLPNAPTRIYGTRNGSVSADDLNQGTKPTAPGYLHRTYTAPEFSDLGENDSDQSRELGTTPNGPGPADESRINRRIAVTSSRLTVQSQDSAGGHNLSQSDLRYSSDIAGGSTTIGPAYEDEVRVSELGPTAITLESAANHPDRNVLKPVNVQEDHSPVDLPTTKSKNQTDSRLRVPSNISTSSMHMEPTAATSSEPNRVVSSQKMPDSLRQESGPSGIEPVLQPAVRVEQSGYARDLPRSQTPVPSNYTTEEKSKSLKGRLRRALSFSSATNLSEMADSETRRSTTPLPQSARNSSKLYGQKNRSTDNVSISSTASSASVMLRKIGHGLSKKTKRSLGGIFSGANARSKERDSTGTPVPFENTLAPTVGAVNYVNAEVDINDRPLSPQREIFPNHTRAQGSISSIQNIPRPPTVEVTKAADNVDGHGSVAFPKLSQEISVEDDRSRRASMHLERPLPIDLVVKDDKLFSLRHSPWRSKADFAGPKEKSVTQPIRKLPKPLTNNATFSGKGILKKSVGPESLYGSLVAHDELLPTDETTEKSTNAFDFAFEPVSDIEEFSVAIQDTATTTTTPAATRTPPTTISSTILKFSPRITIHDTYPANEYDRRGEISTCNRLTPLLAQRIKEELNAYKMDEMEVASESRMYTHFFS